MSEAVAGTTTGTPQSTGDDAKRGPNPRRRDHGPGWFAPLFWLALCAAIVILRSRSFKHSDFVLFHTRSGDVQGVASHKGQVLLAVSTLSLGRERALTIERDTEPAESFDRLYHLVYGSVQDRKEFLGFGFAATQKGEAPGDATHSAFAAPHWFLALLAGLPALRGVWLLVRYYTRPGRGRCRNCGYDLRGSGGAVPGARCPECGEVVADEQGAPAASGGRRRGVGRAVVPCVVLLFGAAAAYALRLSRPAVPPDHPEFSPEQVRAGFARPVGRIDCDDVPLEEVLRRLSAATGTRIDVDWGQLAGLDVNASSDVSVHFAADLPLGTAVQRVFEQLGRKRPEVIAAADGIRIAAYPPAPPPQLVRVYDVRPLLSGIRDEPLPAAAPVPPRGGVVLRRLLPGPASRRAEARATLVAMLQKGGLARPSYAMMGGRLYTVYQPSSSSEGVYEFGDRLVIVQTEHEQWRARHLLRDANLKRNAPRGPAAGGASAGIIPR